MDNNESFAWQCPYCAHHATITSEKYTAKNHFFDQGNKDRDLAIRTCVTVCPNPSCREYTIEARLHHAYWSYGTLCLGDELRRFTLRPRSPAKQFPDYIPSPIRQDYEEACLIRDLSPKAAATLARRCLQGAIRDFWGIRKNRLIDEINELEDKVDPAVWAAIDAVRKVGNIGAHMEKDINLVIEVEPHEAGLLIELIELLFKEWYMARAIREERLAAIKQLATSKKPQAAGELELAEAEKKGS